LTAGDAPTTAVATTPGEEEDRLSADIADEHRLREISSSFFGIESSLSSSICGENSEAVRKADKGARAQGIFGFPAL
jgi:hypothetical protein